MDDEREDPVREAHVIFRHALIACPELAAQIVKVPNTATTIRIPAKLMVLQAVLSHSTEAHHRPVVASGIHTLVNNIGESLADANTSAPCCPLTRCVGAR